MNTNLNRPVRQSAERVLFSVNSQRTRTHTDRLRTVGLFVSLSNDKWLVDNTKSTDDVKYCQEYLEFSLPSVL